MNDNLKILTNNTVRNNKSILSVGRTNKSANKTPDKVDLLGVFKQEVRKAEKIAKETINESINEWNSINKSEIEKNIKDKLIYLKKTIISGKLPYTQAKLGLYKKDKDERDRAQAYLSYVSYKLKESFNETKYHKKKLKETGFQFGTIYITSPIKKISISDKKSSVSIPTIRTQEPMTFRPVRAKVAKYVTVTIEFPTELEVNIEFRHILAQYIAFPYTQIRNKDIARLVLPIDSNIDIYYSYFPILAREYVNKATINYKIEKDNDKNGILAKFNPEDVIAWDPKEINKKRQEIMDTMYSRIPLFFNISSITVDPISSSPDAITVNIELLLGDLEPLTRGKRLLFFNNIEGVLEQAGRWANITFSNYMPKDRIARDIIKYKPATYSINAKTIQTYISSNNDKSINKTIDEKINFGIEPDKDANYGIIDISLYPSGIHIGKLIKNAGNDNEKEIRDTFLDSYQYVIDNSLKEPRNKTYNDWYDARVVNLMIAKKEADSNSNDDKLKANIYNIPFIYNGGHLYPILKGKDGQFGPEAFLINNNESRYIPTYFNMNKTTEAGYGGTFSSDQYPPNATLYNYMTDDSLTGKEFFVKDLFFRSTVAQSTTKANKLTNINSEQKYTKIVARWKDLIKKQYTSEAYKGWIESPFKTLPAEYGVIQLIKSINNRSNTSALNYHLNYPKIIFLGKSQPRSQLSLSTPTNPTDNQLKAINILSLDISDNEFNTDNIKGGIYNNVSNIYNYTAQVYDTKGNVYNSIEALIYSGSDNINYYNKVDKNGYKFKLIDGPIRPDKAIKNNNDEEYALKYELYFLLNVEFNTIYPIIIFQKATEQNDTIIDYNKSIQVMSLPPIYSLSHISEIKGLYFENDVNDIEIEKITQDLISAIDTSSFNDELETYITTYENNLSFYVPDKLNDLDINSCIHNLKPSVSSKIKSFMLNHQFRIKKLANNDFDDMQFANNDESDEKINLEDAVITYIEADENATYNIPKSYLTENMAASVPFIKYYTTMLYEYQLNCSKKTADKKPCEIIKQLEKRAPHLLPDGEPLQTMGSYPIIYPYRKGSNDSIILSYRSITNSSYFGTLLEVDINSILTAFNQTLSHYLDKFITRLLPKDPSNMMKILNGIKTNGDKNFIDIDTDENSDSAVSDAVDFNNELFKIMKTIFGEVQTNVSEVINYINNIDAFRNRYNNLKEELAKMATAPEYTFNIKGKSKRSISLKQYIYNKTELRNTIAKEDILSNILIINTFYYGKTTSGLYKSLINRYNSLYGKNPFAYESMLSTKTIKQITRMIDPNNNMNMSNSKTKIGIKDADIIILTVGISEIQDIVSNKMNVDTFISNIKGLINKIHIGNTNAKIVLLSIPPYENKKMSAIENVAPTKIKSVIDNMNNELRNEYSNIKYVTYIDITQSLRQNYNVYMYRKSVAFSLKKAGYNMVINQIFNNVSFTSDNSSSNTKVDTSINLENEIFGNSNVYATYYDYILLYFAAISLKGLDLLDTLSVNLKASVGNTLRNFRQRVLYYKKYYEYLMQLIINGSIPTRNEFKKMVKNTALKTANNNDEGNRDVELNEYMDDYDVLSSTKTVISELRRITKQIAEKEKAIVSANSRIFLLPNKLVPIANLSDKLTTLTNSIISDNPLLSKARISDSTLLDLRRKYKTLIISYPSYQSNDILKWKRLSIKNEEKNGIYTVIDTYNITTLNNSIPIHMDGHDNPNVVNLSGPTKAVTLSFVTNNMDLLDKIANMAIDYNIPMRKYNLLRGLSPLASRTIKEHSVKNELIYDARTNDIIKKIIQAEGSNLDALNSSTSDTPVFITNEIANMVGVQALVIDEITYDTVPDATNTFVVTIQFRSVDPKQSDRETPTKQRDNVDNFFILSDFASILSGLWFHKDTSSNNNGIGAIQRNGGLNYLIEGLTRNLEKLAAAFVFFYILTLDRNKIKWIYEALESIGKGKEQEDYTSNIKKFYDIVLLILNNTLIADMLEMIDTNNKEVIELKYGSYISDVIRKAHNILYTPGADPSFLGTVRNKNTKDIGSLTKGDMKDIRNTLLGLTQSSSPLTDKLSNNDEIGNLLKIAIQKINTGTISDNGSFDFSSKDFYLNDTFFITLIRYLTVYRNNPENIYDELSAVEESLIDHNDGKTFGMMFFTTILSRSINLHQSLLFMLSKHYSKIAYAYKLRNEELNNLVSATYGWRKKKQIRTYNANTIARYKAIYNDWADKINKALNITKNEKRYMLNTNYGLTTTGSRQPDMLDNLVNITLVTRKVIDLYMSGLMIRNTIAKQLRKIDVKYVVKDILGGNPGNVSRGKINLNNLSFGYDKLNAHDKGIKLTTRGVKVTTHIENIFDANGAKITYNIQYKDKDDKIKSERNNLRLNGYKWLLFKGTRSINDCAKYSFVSYTYIDLLIYHNNANTNNRQSYITKIIKKVVYIATKIAQIVVLKISNPMLLSLVLSGVVVIKQAIDKLDNTKSLKFLMLINSYTKSLFISFRLIGLFNKYITVPFLSFILTHNKLQRAQDLINMKLKASTNHKYLWQGENIVKDLLPINSKLDIPLYSSRSVFFLIKDIIDNPWFKQMLFDRFNAYQDRPLPIIIKLHSNLLKRFDEKKYLDFNKHDTEILNLVNFITSPDFFVYKDPILLTAEYNVMRSMLDNMLGRAPEMEVLSDVDSISINDEYKRKLDTINKIMETHIRRYTRSLIKALSMMSAKMASTKLHTMDNNIEYSSDNIDNIASNIINILYEILGYIEQNDITALNNITNKTKDLNKKIKKYLNTIDTIVKGNAVKTGNKTYASVAISNISADSRELLNKYREYIRTVLILRRLMYINLTKHLTNATKAFIDNIMNPSSGAYTDDSLRIMSKKLELTRIINSKVIQPGTFGHAMPTYKLYIIEENENRLLLFNDFYSYSSVKSISIHRDKKSATSVAVIEVTNVYGRLTDILNARLLTENPLASRPDSRENITSFMLRPGAMIQIRLGFSGYLGPESVVFSGEIVEIKGQEVLTITAQGWGSQLTKPIGTGEGTDIAGGLIESLFRNTYTSAGTIMALMNLPDEGVHHLGGVDPFVGQLAANRRGIDTYASVWKEYFLNYLGSTISNTTGVPVTMVDTTLTNIALVDVTQQGWGWGSRRWLVYNETIWDAISDYLLQFPGYHMKIAEMDEEGTIVIGKSTDLYQYTYEYNMYTAQIAPVLNSIRSGIDNPVRGLNILIDLLKNETNKYSKGSKKLILGPISQLFIKSVMEFISSFPFQELMSELLNIIARNRHFNVGNSKTAFGELLVGTLIGNNNINLNKATGISALETSNLIEKYVNSFNLSYKDWNDILSELNDLKIMNLNSNSNQDIQPADNNHNRPSTNNNQNTQITQNNNIHENTYVYPFEKEYFAISYMKLLKLNDDDIEPNASNINNTALRLAYICGRYYNTRSFNVTTIKLNKRVGNIIETIYNDNNLYQHYKRQDWHNFFNRIDSIYNAKKTLFNNDLDQSAYYIMVFKEWWEEGISNINAITQANDLLSIGREEIMSLIMTESNFRMFNNSVNIRQCLMNNKPAPKGISNYICGARSGRTGCVPQKQGIGLTQITTPAFENVIDKTHYVNSTNSHISDSNYIKTIDGRFGRGIMNALPIGFIKLGKHLINESLLREDKKRGYNNYIKRDFRTLGIFMYTLMGQHIHYLMRFAGRSTSRFGGNKNNVSIIDIAAAYNGGQGLLFPKRIRDAQKESFAQIANVSVYLMGINPRRESNIIKGLSKFIIDFYNANTGETSNITLINNNNGENIQNMIIYILSKTTPVVLENIVYEIANTTPGFRPFSAVHLKTASKDIIQNNIELKDGYNRVDMSYLHDNILGYTLGTLLDMPLLASLSGSTSITIAEINNPSAHNNIQIAASPVLDPTKVKTYATFQKNAAIRSTFSTPRHYVVANSILANLINDYYGGEIILNLDPTIREYDIIMLYDDVNDYWGMIQVGAVTHMLSQEYGAVTIIKPDLYAENGISLSRETLGALGTLTSAVSYFLPIISWFVISKLGFGMLKWGLKFVGKLWKSAGKSAARTFLKKAMMDDAIAQKMIRKNSGDVVNMVDDMLLTITKGELRGSAKKRAVDAFMRNIDNVVDDKKLTKNIKKRISVTVDSLIALREQFHAEMVRNDNTISKLTIQRKYAEKYMKILRTEENIDYLWKTDVFMDQLMDSEMFNTSIGKLTSMAINEYLAPFTSRSWFGGYNPKTNSMGAFGVYVEILSRMIRIGASYRIGKMIYGDPTKFSDSFVARAGEYYFMREPITISGLYHRGEPFIANLDGMKKVDIAASFTDILGRRWHYMWSSLSEIMGGLEVMEMDIGNITSIFNGNT